MLARSSEEGPLRSVARRKKQRGLQGSAGGLGRQGRSGGYLHRACRHQEGRHGPAAFLVRLTNW